MVGSKNNRCADTQGQRPYTLRQAVTLAPLCEVLYLSGLGGGGGARSKLMIYARRHVRDTWECARSWPDMSTRVSLRHCALVITTHFAFNATCSPLTRDSNGRKRIARESCLWSSGMHPFTSNYTGMRLLDRRLEDATG